MADFTHEQADGALADALWWFRGFKAAQPQTEVYADPTYDMGNDLLKVRNWIKGLARGHTRLIGLDDREQAFVFTEAEFERIFDGLRDNSTEEDRRLAKTTVNGIYDQVRRERAANPDLPF